MNITQALRRIAAIKGELSDVSGRIPYAATQYDEEPQAYQFGELMEARDKLLKDLVLLKGKVAEVNATTLVEDGDRKRPLVDILHELTQLKGTIELIKSVNSKPVAKGVDKDIDWDFDDEGKQVRTTVEKPWTCSLPERDKDALLKKLRDRFARLNNLVETANAVTQVE